MKPEEFLLKEYDHFAESFWKNEEIGEKRLNLFIGFTTIIISGIIALSTFEPKDWGKITLDEDLVKEIAIFALIGNLVLGLNIFFRILRRNQVTQSYGNQLAKIRDHLKELAKDQLSKYPKYEAPGKSFYVGGYAETIASINALLLAGILIIYCENNITSRIIISILFFLIQLLMIPYFGEKIPIIKKLYERKKAN